MTILRTAHCLLRPPFSTHSEITFSSNCDELWCSICATRLIVFPGATEVSCSSCPSDS
ncbi:hypothetical protein ACFQ7U_02425 [Streptomyces rubiginosohelvolus]|uniref:zinc finger domain-containing protein n=1 Tax=Streptomyces rubiginosohelvolus TaxID=67362 RepID=UPI00369CC25F